MVVASRTSANTTVAVGDVVAAFLARRANEQNLPVHKLQYRARAIAPMCTLVVCNLHQFLGSHACSFQESQNQLKRTMPLFEIVERDFTKPRDQREQTIPTERQLVLAGGPAALCHYSKSLREISQSAATNGSRPFQPSGSSYWLAALPPKLHSNHDPGNRQDIKCPVSHDKFVR